MGTGWAAGGPWPLAERARAWRHSAQPPPAPRWRRSHFGGPAARRLTRVPGPSGGAPAPSPRKVEKTVPRLGSRTPFSTPAPPCSAVTQPRCPGPAEPSRGCRRETQTLRPRLSRDPRLQAASATPLRPVPSRPIPSGWPRGARDFPPLRSELSSQDQVGAGPGPGRPAPAGNASLRGHL